MLNKKKLFLIIALYLSISVVNASNNNELLLDGKVQISKQQFLNALQRMDDKTRDQFLSSEKRVFKAVQNYYITQAAVIKAKNSGLYNTPKMQALIEKAIGDAVIKEMYQNYLDKTLNQKKFDSLAFDYYKVNQNKYKTQPEVDVSHILISTTERSEDQARTLAEEIRNRLLAGENFTALAIHYSDDPSVTRNKGRIGFFTHPKMVKPFSDVAFLLKNKDDISQVVKTKFGFHVLRLEAIKESSIIPFQQVKDKIIEKIQKSEIAKINQRFKDDLLDIEHIEINRELIKSLVTKK